MEGIAKTAALRREGRRWVCVIFWADGPAVPLAPTGQSVGIDVGIANLVATSDGNMVANPRPGRASANRVAGAQRAVARKRRGSNRRRKAVAHLADLRRHDAGLATLLRFVTHKAESASRDVIAVRAAYTSQTCSTCGHIAKENRLSQAVFRCQACRHTTHADTNAATNIHHDGPGWPSVAIPGAKRTNNQRETRGLLPRGP